jgi:hypothetical protein
MAMAIAIQVGIERRGMKIKLNGRKYTRMLA